MPDFLSRVKLWPKSGACNSSSLREWLFRTHQGCIPHVDIPYVESNQNLGSGWVLQEFTIVKNMAGVPWKLVEKVLDGHEKAVLNLKRKYGRGDRQEWWQA